MGTQAILDRIRQDADAECEAILAEAQARAEAILASAEERAAQDLRETEEELASLTRRMADVNAAAARLDSAKIFLAEKRRVIETVYGRALAALNSLGEKDALRLLEKLLLENAEEGDEIVFDENYPYSARASELPVVKERALRVSEKRMKLGGGCMLSGKRCDKDLSYPALLAADMEKNQSSLAEKLSK